MTIFASAAAPKHRRENGLRGPVTLCAVAAIAWTLVLTHGGFQASDAAFTAQVAGQASATAAADWTPPVVTIETDDTQSYEPGQIELTIATWDRRSEVDAVSVQLREGEQWTQICEAARQSLDGQDALWSCTWDTSTLADGTYTLRVLAVDAYDNRGSSGERTFTITAAQEPAEDPGAAGQTPTDISVDHGTGTGEPQTPAQTPAQTPSSGSTTEPVTQPTEQPQGPTCTPEATPEGTSEATSGSTDNATPAASSAALSSPDAQNN